MTSTRPRPWLVVRVAPAAAFFTRVGLLQKLSAVQARDGKHCDVVAGGRHLAALKQLARSGRIPKEWAVPCLLVASADARAMSLTENVRREAMHRQIRLKLLLRWRLPIEINLEPVGLPDPQRSGAPGACE